MTKIYWNMKIWNILKQGTENVWKNDVKVGVGKIKDTKHGLFVFSNARSILELMLCNQNLAKLVYPTLLSSHCRAWALKFSEQLKK